MSPLLFIIIIFVLGIIIGKYALSNSEQPNLKTTKPCCTNSDNVETKLLEKPQSDPEVSSYSTWSYVIAVVVLSSGLIALYFFHR